MNSANSVKQEDITGEALKAQRFRMLEDIAKELAGEVVFPTYFDAVLRLRKALQDPDKSIGDIANVVMMEPLISAKLLQLANSVAYNPGGKEIIDLKSAISRLGLQVVKNTAMAIVMAQLLRAKNMVEFTELTQSLWQHTIKTAATARILARAKSGINPEEAMFAGLIHDLGAFYMLYRATQYDDLRSRPDSLKYLMINWHESIGVSLLDALGIPQEIVDATIDHDHPRTLPMTIRTLSDLVYVANMLAGGHYEWLMQDEEAMKEDIEGLQKQYAEYLPAIEEFTQEMLATFA